MGSWTTILVGVDGSPGSRTALTWAAAEAAEHKADLAVLSVWERALPAAVGSVPQHGAADPGQDATERLLDIVREELGADPPVPVRAQVQHGNPAQVLIEHSADVDLLVVGTRGQGGFAGLVLGSVSQHVAAYAKCPVAVIR